MLKKILLIFLVILVSIQFIRPARNISNSVSQHDIIHVYPVPDTIQRIMKVACNDCHSNNTRYPWYANIQPVAWWLKAHIDEGKEHLNYSEFASYKPEKQYDKMKETVKLVKNDEMPLDSYLWIHKDAVLTQQQKQMIIEWAGSCETG